MYSKVDINQFIDELVKKEGSYVNDPNDPGGETCWGWTVKNARARGYAGDMRYFPLKLAKQWYFEDYWLAPNFNELYKVNHAIASELFDSGVNVGSDTALKWLQEALNALNRQGKDFPDLIVDGVAGSKTIDALDKYLAKRNKNGVIVMMRCLNAFQTSYYKTISKKNEKLEDFFFGWVLNRVVM